MLVKFSGILSVTIIILSVTHLTFSNPIDLNSFVLLNDGENFEDAINSENYDIIIDQRQNGTQNFRFKVSGINIAIPDEREQTSPSSSPPSLEQFATLLSSQGGTNNDDFTDLSAFFDWKKKSNENKKSEDTQSRTKDIPTTDQSKIKIKDIVTEERRKYKLLVGEKYIVPILRFLKKQTEDVKE